MKESSSSRLWAASGIFLIFLQMFLDNFYFNM
jgi:hypothetical protein